MPVNGKRRSFAKYAVACFTVAISPALSPLEVVCRSRWWNASQLLAWWESHGGEGSWKARFHPSHQKNHKPQGPVYTYGCSVCELCVVPAEPHITEDFLPTGICHCKKLFPKSCTIRGQLCKHSWWNWEAIGTTQWIIPLGAFMNPAQWLFTVLLIDQEC